MQQFLLSLGGKGRRITVLARQRQVMDFSGERENLRAQSGPLSWNFQHLSEAKALQGPLCIRLGARRVS